MPGCIAKLYKKEETEIPLGPLANWAEVDFINQEVVGIDFDSKEIILGEAEEGKGEDNSAITGVQSRGRVSYDVLSIDIGSTARGLDIPGVMEYAIPTRPIDALIGEAISPIGFLGNFNQN